jgi:hypothetical protein
MALKVAFLREHDVPERKKGAITDEWAGDRTMASHH